MIDRAQDHNGGGQTGQIEPAQALPVGQRKGDIERRDKRVRSPGAKPFQIVSGELAHVVAGTKVPLKHGDARRNRERETKHIRGVDRRTKAAPQK